jgi:FdrA protein
VSWQVRTLADRYADSVRLMGIARALRDSDGVAAAEVVMGTPANLQALAALGASVDAGPGDVVIAVDGEDGAGDAALAQVERLLATGSAPVANGAGPAPPRTLSAATARLAGANVALVSVPGEYATLEAHRALTRGLHVFLFSDHVAVEDEVELKRRGAERGLLVMGPECGTAMLGGAGLGFANVVRRGPVGIVAAAGTGAQEVACLLHAAGSGVSHIVGVGGRDLSATVGAVMFRQGMELLASDPQTETLLLVAKEPEEATVRELARALPSGVRCVATFMGMDGGADGLEIHPTLEAGALAAAGAAAPDERELERAVDAGRDRAAGRRVLGLYSGGSLAHEAALVLGAQLGPVEEELEAVAGDGHVVLDLGTDRFTQGRPHPMVDFTIRRDLLEEAAEDGRTGCVLLDVVCGYGAHGDPAGELTAAIAKATRQAIVVARVCGTDEDPQDARRQAAALREAGALVAPSNAAAARMAARAVRA